MAIPWYQIARLVPTVLSLSNELLQQTRKSTSSSVTGLDARVAEHQDHERKQAELVKKMAEQLAALAEASIALRKQLRMLLILTVLALLTGITALALALA